MSLLGAVLIQTTAAALDIPQERNPATHELIRHFSPWIQCSHPSSVHQALSPFHRWITFLVQYSTVSICSSMAGHVISPPGAVVQLWTQKFPRDMFSFLLGICIRVELLGLIILYLSFEGPLSVYTAAVPRCTSANTVWGIRVFLPSSFTLKRKTQPSPRHESVFYRGFGLHSLNGK